MFESDVINNGSQASPADPVLSGDLVEGQPLTEAAAEGWLPHTCFKHGPPAQIGLELEFILHDRSRAAHLPPDRLSALHHELLDASMHSRFTTEPGGQVELSSRPAPDLTAVVRAVAADLAVITPIVARHQARLVGAGVDPLPRPERSLTTCRYDAMEGYLDQWGSAGRAMMRSTASVQVNVEAGRAGHPESDLRRRWDLLHALGPALIAAFGTAAPGAWATRATLTASASDAASDAGEQWRDCANPRQGIWQVLDPARCTQPVIGRHESLPEAWARWVLDAPLLMVRRPGPSWSAPPGLTFRQWLRAGQAAIPDRPHATLDDLRQHLTTLFPPVRARGHLEVRYLDAQPGPWWRVPAAVISALLEDDAAGDAALALTEPLTEPLTESFTEPLGGPPSAPVPAGAGSAWHRAARDGLADPGLAVIAPQVLDLARDVLDRSGRPEEKSLAGLIDQYRERWTARGHTPATRPETAEHEPS